MTPALIFFLLRFGTGNDVLEDHIHTGCYSRYLLPVFVIAYMSFLYRCQTTGATVTDAATPAASAKAFDFPQELYSTGTHCWTR